VPPGTLVIDAAGKFVLRDLSTAGDTVIVAQGGKGGRGNAQFKSSTNQAPRKFTLGEPGERRRLILELKVIADVGVIGKPNAGKSTLLSRLSRARPEIADYPFTTKHPNLGLVEVDRDRTFVLADIPGLIEGAHRGIGLGHDFLRHVERCSFLLHLVEPEPVDGTDPVDNWRSTRQELELYDPALAQRPELVVMSKNELPEAVKALSRLEAATGGPVLSISAATGDGLRELVRRTVALLDGSRRPVAGTSQ
jgi:GTP-binding protein